MRAPHRTAPLRAAPRLSARSVDTAGDKTASLAHSTGQLQIWAVLSLRREKATNKL